jgi:hypothetical protein
MRNNTERLMAMAMGSAFGPKVIGKNFARITIIMDG